jgi:hypothetical protein
MIKSIQSGVGDKIFAFVINSKVILMALDLDPYSSQTPSDFPAP